MKRKLYAFLMYAAFLSLMLSPAPASAQEMPADSRSIKAGNTYEGGAENVIRAQAGATPGSYFYGLKRFGERINLFLTFDKLEKAKLKYVFAERRLAEAAALAGKNDALAEGAIQEYDRDIGRAEEYIAEASASGRNITSFAEMVGSETYAHVFILEKVYQKIPENAKPSMLQVIENSIERHESMAEKYRVPRVRKAGENYTDYLVNITVSAGNQTILREVPAPFAEKFFERKKELKGMEPAMEKEISEGDDRENKQPAVEEKESANVKETESDGG